MGGFASFLGDAAKGYSQAAREDTQRQFEMEHDKRAAFTDLLGKLANDPTAHPETQQAALQGIAALHAAPWNKPVKYEPIIHSLITRGPQQPTQTATTAGPTQGTPHDLTNLIPQGQPMPTPPTSEGRPAPQVSQQATYQPPPNMGMRYTPQEQAGLAGQEAGAVAGGKLGGEISARQGAMAGMPPLPPEEQVGFALGTPGLMGMIGAAGRVDDMPASVAAQAGYPLPPGTNPADPNAWVRLRRNKLNSIVGSDAIPVPAPYAPSVNQGFVKSNDAAGNEILVPEQTVRQKQLPTPPGTAQPTAKVEPHKSQVIGKMKPPQALLIAPPTAPGQQPTAMAVRPGSKVPEGAVTAQGYSSVSVPTAGTRTRSEFAQGLLPRIDPTIALIRKMDKEGKLGPMKGRWNEFMAGKVGAGDPEFDQLRTDIGLLQTGMMVPHVGARGGTSLIAKFKGMVDSGKMDATGLTTALGEWKKFLTTYAKEGDLKGWGQEPAHAPDTSWHSLFGGAVR